MNNLIRIIAISIIMVTSCDQPTTTEETFEANETTEEMSNVDYNVDLSDIKIFTEDSIEYIKEINQIHLCTEKLPPPPPSMKMKYSSDTTNFIRSDYTIDTLVFNKVKPTRPYIIGLNYYKWPTTKLTVMFLDGDPVVIRRVINEAKKWEKICGIRFNFGEFEDPDITISFLYRGSWSYIGNYSRKMRPSMNYGWLTRETNDEELSRVVLHEFGHALGFSHEHKTPNDNPIVWNKPAVYAYYKETENWDEDEVNEQVINRYSKSEIRGTSFDKNSIMIYAIPPGLTMNNFTTEWNTTFSEADKKFAREYYPIQGLSQISSR